MYFIAQRPVYVAHIDCMLYYNTVFFVSLGVMKFTIVLWPFKKEY